MIVTRTRVGDHICKMSELFYYFFNCWSGYHCTFTRDPLQRSNMFSKDKPGILFIAPIKHHGKKQQNLSKFEVGFELHAQAADLRLRW